MLRAVDSRAPRQVACVLPAGRGRCCARRPRHAPRRPERRTSAAGGSLAPHQRLHLPRAVSKATVTARCRRTCTSTAPTAPFSACGAPPATATLEPDADYDLETYLGHRFDLSNTWSATLSSARSHYFVGGTPGSSRPTTRRLAASLTLPRPLDAVADGHSECGALLRITTAPEPQHRLGRRHARPVAARRRALRHRRRRLLPLQRRTRTDGLRRRCTAPGYAYGNVGLAFEYRRWRLDVGYFVAQSQAQELVPYPVANHRVAATVSWRF